MKTVQVKICGLTDASQAKDCALLGADAIGIVFYEKSPRYVSTIAAGRIAQAVNGVATAVGVTVDMDIDELLCTAMNTGISVFQLHGSESGDYVHRLRMAGIRVIKHIKGDSRQLRDLASKYEDAFAFIAESGSGTLPGGNGADWDWSQAASLAGDYRFVLAGGLNCDNVSDAIAASQADAVDVSSSLESRLGVKDIKLVADFIRKVKQTKITNQVQRIF